MSRKIVLITFFVFVHLFSSWCNAGSIWAKRGPNSKSIYSDDKANQIGDILTIVINEDSKIDSKVERDLEKKTSRDLTFDDNKCVRRVSFFGHSRQPVFCILPLSADHLSV